MIHAKASEACSTLAAATLLLAAGQAASEPGGRGTGEFLGGVETTYPAWFKSSFLEFADDVADAAEQGKRVIIFFHQDGCPYCNALVERNLSQKHIEEKIRANFDVVALNLRGDREVVSVAGESFTEKSFARALNVQFTPTLLFLDEQGRKVLRLNGYVPPPEFEAALDYVAERKEDEIDYREYLSRRVSGRQGGELNQAAFFAESPYDLAAAGRRGKPLAVFFEQRHCPNCDTLHADVLGEPETGALLESFYAVQLDMWSDEPLVTPSGARMSAREWAGALDVRYAPTIIVFTPEGEEIIRGEAYLKRFHTQTLLDYAASGAYREEADFQRFLTERADDIRARGEDVNIWQ
jgi:thioredoxin-related protein